MGEIISGITHFVFLKCRFIKKTLNNLIRKLAGEDRSGVEVSSGGQVVICHTPKLFCVAWYVAVPFVDRYRLLLPRSLQLCGEGVVDWERMAEIMAPVDREIFLSVECGKIDEAERGISYLNKALAKWLA